jgi:hypothetical protein
MFSQWAKVEAQRHREAYLDWTLSGRRRKKSKSSKSSKGRERKRKALRKISMLSLVLR